MSIVGTYELELTCDHITAKDAKGDAITCSHKQTFLDTTRMEALATARYDGWLITRSRTALCPEHAAIRRERWT